MGSPSKTGFTAGGTHHFIGLAANAHSATKRFAKMIAYPHRFSDFRTVPVDLHYGIGVVLDAGDR
jgi:hypothetical protein